MTIKPILTPEQYAVERAICDKANAYWKANATFNCDGSSSMSRELSAHPDYAACDNAMRGRVEQYELLTDPPEAFGAYVGERTAFQFDRHDVTTWTGDKIGTCFIGKGWRVTDCYGARMHQIYATINGREYTGRGQGKGMFVSLRETAASKRARAGKAVA